MTSYPYLGLTDPRFLARIPLYEGTRRGHFLGAFFGEVFRVVWVQKSAEVYSHDGEGVSDLSALATISDAAPQQTRKRAKQEKRLDRQGEEETESFA